MFPPGSSTDVPSFPGTDTTTPSPSSSSPLVTIRTRCRPSLRDRS